MQGNYNVIWAIAGILLIVVLVLLLMGKLAIG
jgi:hypothetical protein